MSKNLARTTIFMMLIIVFSKMLGFGREVVLASQFGASAQSDAYIVAMTIPTIIFTSIGSAISTTFIPLYSEIRENEGRKKSLKFTNNVFNMVTICCIIISIFGMVFTKFFVKIFAMGFEGQTLELAISFTRVLFPSIIFMGMSSVLIGFLQSRENFIVPEALGIPFNVLIISSIYLGAKFDVKYLLYGTLIAIASRYFFQLPFTSSKGLRYRPYLNFSDKHIKKMLALTVPVFIGISVNQINTLVDKTLASTLVEGSIAALNFANRLTQFVIGLFVVSISTVVYPMLSKLSIKNDRKQFKKTIVQSVNIISLLVVPMSVGAMVLSVPIVELLFKRGAFDASASLMTSQSLFYYSIGMIGFGMRQVLSRVFYSLQDTKTPMVTGAFAMLINIVMNLALVKFMAHSGLALATSISSIAGVILLFYFLRKKIGRFGFKFIARTFVKVSLASAIMGVSVHYAYKLMAFGDSFVLSALRLGLSVFAGALVYLALILVFRVREVKLFFKLIFKRFLK